ncbi:MAG: hypothetical protein K2O49_09425, partial [Muribaculaceae bacterium]|nr:hypothetical protein [Muribaculaceae bacterium]
MIFYSNCEYTVIGNIFFVVRDLHFVMRDISDYLGIVPERFFCTKSEKPKEGGIVGLGRGILEGWLEQK